MVANRNPELPSASYPRRLSGIGEQLCGGHAVVECRAPVVVVQHWAAVSGPLSTSAAGDASRVALVRGSHALP